MDFLIEVKESLKVQENKMQQKAEKLEPQMESLVNEINIL